MSLHDDLVALFDAADADLAAAEATIAERDAEIADSDAVIADLGATIAALQARIAELEAQIPDPDPEPDPDPDPEPEPQSTVFGADATGTSSGAQADVIGKWGAGVAIRQFFTGFTQVAPRDSRAGLVHASWKPSSVSAITEAAVTAAVANLQPGDVVEVWHESDKKVRDGVYTYTEALARKNKFYDVVKAVRPDLLVANTLTGWEADPDNGTTRGNIDKWGAVKADLLGLDCDGIHGYPYPGYDDEPPVAVQFVQDFPSYKGWCVPEFGTSRASNDPNGTARAAWATECAELFEQTGAWYVCLYEYESTQGNAFTTAAELTAWRAFTQ